MQKKSKQNAYIIEIKCIHLHSRWDNIPHLKRDMTIIRKKTMAHRALWVMECPLCGCYAASASERGMLPSYTTCNCDKEERRAMP